MQHEGTDAKSPKNAAGLTRAALLGLTGGILVGGLFLLGVGLKTRLSPADCTGLSEMECSFMREAALELSRMQVIVGSGLLALGAAVVVLLRSKARSDTH
ncbi:hypothetical protein [Archangium lansingense]|uniref:Uncharacterized protein n=1 Tax=Archangium lansingense TaxID=2995310 RepID=A0ABT4A0K0_9BACT|nr:hypothetical protein [Archangium lansinium]MCY1075170.1 hypothetical protein [Archangium lansinium]